MEPFTYQVGRYYPFVGELEAPALGLLPAIKAHVDPHDLINRGSLGL